MSINFIKLFNTLYAADNRYMRGFDSFQISLVERAFITKKILSHHHRDFYDAAPQAQLTANKYFYNVGSGLPKLQLATPAEAVKKTYFFNAAKSLLSRLNQAQKIH